MHGPVQSVLRRLTQATRPLALKKAGKVGSDTSIVCHSGRTTGRNYRTPVVAAQHDDEFLIALPYGLRTDWMKNVTAAGTATLIVNGETYDVDQPQVVPMSEATAHFGRKEQMLHRRFSIDSCLRVHRVAASS
jgi:deazaflavin-dependent oxidoreductase (nitroreductase family)